MYNSKGDSGGPLVIKFDDGSYYQVGIVSWGRGMTFFFLFIVIRGYKTRYK